MGSSSLHWGCHSSHKRNGASLLSCWSRGRFHQRPTKNGTVKPAASACPNASSVRSPQRGRKRVQLRNVEGIRQCSGRNVSCTFLHEGPPEGGHYVRPEADTTHEGGTHE